MAGDVAVVFDCGATNLRVMAVDSRGQTLASASRRSKTTPQPQAVSDEWRIWDLEEVWGKLAGACQEVCRQVDTTRIAAVTVTTFGADGAPVRSDGTLTYPIISWQGTRTQQLTAEIAQLMDPWEIFQETGYQIIYFNTLLRLMWLRQNAPEALQTADCWLMMPGILSMTLCGELSIDPTAAGTMMAMNMETRDWSAQMLGLAGLDESFFPDWVEPGEVIGTVHSQAAEETGLPKGTLVVVAGHDTQFAPYGSGMQPGEALLSSGTWEILLLRIDEFTPTRFAFEEGLLFECDALPDLWNPQLLMMGSGVLEWIRQQLFSTGDGEPESYQRMIQAARAVAPGADGVSLIPSFVADTGPTKKYSTEGTILGLTMNATAAQIYRAGLEGLCFQMRSALEILQKATGFTAEGIRVVGGGARNDLWNQIRADVSGLPVVTTSQQEATVLGAALFALIGAGQFDSIQQAVGNIKMGATIYEPSEVAEKYASLYQRYMEVPPALQCYYKGRNTNESHS